jgi:hypothetical protein
MIYDSFPSDLLGGDISPKRDQFAMLLVNGYHFDRSHSKRSDVDSTEPTSSGYAKGGKPTTVTPTKLGARTTLVFADVRWDISGQMTATGGVVYKKTGGPASEDPLVCYLDFGKAVTCTDSTFTAHFAKGLGFEAKQSPST